MLDLNPMHPGSLGDILACLAVISIFGILFYLMRQFADWFGNWMDWFLRFRHSFSHSQYLELLETLGGHPFFDERDVMATESLKHHLLKFNRV